MKGHIGVIKAYFFPLSLRSMGPSKHPAEFPHWGGGGGGGLGFRLSALGFGGGGGGGGALPKERNTSREHDYPRPQFSETPQ